VELASPDRVAQNGSHYWRRLGGGEGANSGAQLPKSNA
jgi:hypothetical protein